METNLFFEIYFTNALMDALWVDHYQSKLVTYAKAKKIYIYVWFP